MTRPKFFLFSIAKTQRKKIVDKIFTKEKFQKAKKCKWNEKKCEGKNFWHDSFLFVLRLIRFAYSFVFRYSSISMLISDATDELSHTFTIAAVSLSLSRRPENFFSVKQSFAVLAEWEFSRPSSKFFRIILIRMHFSLALSFSCAHANTHSQANIPSHSAPL